MKKAHSFPNLARAIVLSVISFAINFTLPAQTTATWKGGKPGSATDWNCSANWSEGRVPDEFTQVVIPTGKMFYPVIQNVSTVIDALMIEHGGTITIKEGAVLVILGETGRFDGLTLFGFIRNDGTFEIEEAVNTGAAYLLQIHGNGIVISPTTGADTLAKLR